MIGRVLCALGAHRWRVHTIYPATVRYCPRPDCGRVHVGTR